MNQSSRSYDLPSAGAEARVFWALRQRILWTLARQALQQARLRTSLIVALTIIFWVGMLFVFLEGFRILQSMITHEGTRVETVHAIFNVFFLSLLGMLTMSSAIILYSSLYRSREACFLLTSPIRVQRIVWFKFQETLLLSCWGFFLLGTPLLVAYGRTVAAPWYYYAMFFPFMVAFAFIPVCLGGILCLLVVRYLPQLRVHAVAAIAILVIAGGGLAIWTLVREANSGPTVSLEWFQRALARLQYSEQRWLPSWWLSSGLLETAHPATTATQTSWHESAGFFCVLASNAMVLFLALGKMAEWHFVEGFSSLSQMGTNRRRAANGWIDGITQRAAAPFPHAMRLLLIKDLRVFRRDALQWSQFAIFFALLTFYFLNARRMQFGAASETWMMVVGYLNVSVVGLLLATFTTRFIYPLISLEGRKFWILGTLPIERRDILWGKFLFALGISLVPCSALILLSDLMLQLGQQSVWVVLLHQITCWAISTGLCAIAVGMGARLPDLRESSPARLASGFGGTLTLVMSVAFIVACVIVSAVPTCFWVAPVSRIDVPAGAGWTEYLQLGTWTLVVFGAIAVTCLSAVVTTVTLRSGARAFRELEP